MIYTPDRWVLIDIYDKHLDWQMPHKPDDVTKVFATWSGSYTTGEEWRLNSGIVETKVEGDYYLFYGESGSCYRCHKDQYGIAGGWNGAVLGRMLEQPGVSMRKEIDESTLPFLSK